MVLVVLVPFALAPWVAGELNARSQDETLASVTSKLQRQDGEADWCLSAIELERRQRAFTPWPGLFTLWEGKVLKLLDVKPSSPDSGQHAEATQQPGRVVVTSGPGSGVDVVTGDGMLELRTVQLEGRRAQSASEFVRGYPTIIGASL